MDYGGLNMAKKELKPIKPINKKGRGRKTITYEDSVKPHLELIIKLRSEGYDEKDIYAALNVSKNKFYEFKRNHDELREALKKGIDEKALNIEKKAFQMALGGIEVSKKKYQRVNGEMLLVEEIIEKTLPNVTMQIFMLKNLMPEKYKERQEVENKYNEEDLKQVESFNEKFEKMMRERDESSNK